MQQARHRDNTAMLNGADLRIAIVQARFNVHLTDRMAEACLDELRTLGVPSDAVHHVTVPGALEVPQALSALAESGSFDALIALGCVIRGDTYHFELVCNTSAAGVQQVALDFGLPVANGIITVDTEEQAISRTDKGAECARVAVEMANLLAEIGA
ncbi:MAG: 6,7-dimethyl-8-ribityllumazine synthase [Betaproteobacteria bacterium]|jgi:6,7-dimethyl-8-ribityllumazine synthase|uniref:6,7-dimethyl-8-ribityllumazine synthase n=1 Tax=Thiomonas delicata TaxID=364030 RepID=A0A238D413_THIDL|nr:MULTISPECIES: 6,7-dimethyl-8-ribityllumazine synthase [Thiomonas]MDE2130890.1 6,7-dimethyl-8-ribityllumazine synthase [Betaproteobacteria bacterium]OZB45312.1 MAG: 6,7-dimethyl-8-ribityllumazine synthase [Thiomonas sp. 15-66-11]OZB63400.1 MAG: 6,7-dimethyl-8-ribityllumazine synthase [Thiomonas sp. 13-66-29]SBP88033.1 riboflavin synthase beta chain [Thiomonas delicata]